MSEDELGKIMEFSIQQYQQQLSNESQDVSEGWWNSTANWMKKKYFNGTHFLDLALNDEKSDNIALFGMKFKSNEQARIMYGSVLWFTYRENLKFYKIKRQYTIKSDVGWGCMLRVGQMMLAHCLRLDLGIEDYDNQKQLQNILKQFILEEGKYSVQNIASKAHQIFGRKPGQWYSPSDIAHVLCDLQNDNKQSNLKMIVYDNEFQWSKTLDFLNENRLKGQKVSKPIKKNKNEINWSIKINPGLIVILCRLGYKSPEPQLIQVVKNFLKNQRNCIGILGGRPGKAHYIFGTSQKNFIYLDPHCVKETNEIDSFFCNSMFCIPHQSIDPSMGLCFYVRNTAELLGLYNRFSSLGKSLPFYSYTKTKLPQIVEIQKVEEKFQILELQNTN